MNLRFAIYDLRFRRACLRFAGRVRSHLPSAIVYCLLAMAPVACRRDMFDQPKSNPLRQSDFFPDQSAARPLPPHTVPQERGMDDSFYMGLNGTNPVTAFPFPIT